MLGESRQVSWPGGGRGGEGARADRALDDFLTLETFNQYQSNFVASSEIYLRTF